MYVCTHARTWHSVQSGIMFKIERAGSYRLSRYIRIPNLEFCAGCKTSAIGLFELCLITICWISCAYTQILSRDVEDFCVNAQKFLIAILDNKIFQNWIICAYTQILNREVEVFAYMCSRDMYITHFYCLAVDAGFYSDVEECLPLDPAAQVRFPPRVVGIFLHPVTFGGHCGGSTACVSGIRMECPGITAWFRVDSEKNQFEAGKYVVGIGI